MLFVSRRADLLERSFQGLPCADQEVRNLVATASRIPALSSAACAPREEFVRTLGLELRAEAMAMPTGQAHRGPSAATTPRSATKPLVLVIGKGLRAVAVATASLLLVGAVVGVSSRSALPGGLLYPVKQVLNSVAVQLAGSKFDAGVTLLSQAQADIGDARALVERDRVLADPASLNQALLSAFDSAKTGQRELLGEFDRTRDAQTLINVQDFTVRAMPQLKALRLQVPAASRADVEALIALLHESQTTLARKIAVCGQPCRGLGDARPGSSNPSAPSTGPSFTLPAGGLPKPGLRNGGLRVVAPVPDITGPGGLVMGRPGLPLPKTGGAILPPVTVGSITIRPSPILIPFLPPLTRTPTLAPPPTGIAGLP
jgi:hypothetical protein